MKKLANIFKFLLFYPVFMVVLLCILIIVTLGMGIYLSKELWGVLNFEENEYTDTKGLDADSQKALRVQEQQNKGRAQTLH